MSMATKAAAAAATSSTTATSTATSTSAAATAAAPTTTTTKANNVASPLRIAVNAKQVAKTDAQNRGPNQNNNKSTTTATAANSTTTSAEPRTPTNRKRRTPEEDALSIEAYLSRECERQVQQVMTHVDRRIADFEREAKRVRGSLGADR